MIATPAQRNRLMQKLKAETWIRRKNGSCEERNDEMSLRVKGGSFSGDSVPRPLGFFALMPSQRIKFAAGAQLLAEPQPGLGPGVGAQLASQQRSR